MENSEIMQARRELLKKLNVMVRKVEEVTAFVLAGEQNCPPYEIHIVTAGKAEDLEKIFADLHFLVTEFLKPQTQEKEETDGRTVAKYRFESGLFLELFICTGDSLPSFDWWLPYFDRHGAAEDFYLPEGKVDEDPVKDIPEAWFLPDTEESAPADLSPAPSPAAEAAVSDAATWEAIYEKINLAKHANAGGSVIYAAEVMNELRTLLIRLICEKNGIHEDYLHSIDLLATDDKRELLKTYPSGLENGAMVAALAAELRLFEKLMN